MQNNLHKNIKKIFLINFVIALLHNFSLSKNVSIFRIGNMSIFSDILVNIVLDVESRIKISLYKK